MRALRCIHLKSKWGLEDSFGRLVAIGQNGCLRLQLLGIFCMQLLLFRAELCILKNTNDRSIIGVLLATNESIKRI